MFSINRTQFGRKEKKDLREKIYILTKKLKKKNNKLSSGKEDSRELSKASRIRVYYDSLFFKSSFIFLVMNMNSIVYFDSLLAMIG